MAVTSIRTQGRLGVYIGAILELVIEFEKLAKLARLIMSGSHLIYLLRTESKLERSRDNIFQLRHW